MRDRREMPGMSTELLSWAVLFHAMVRLQTSRIAAGSMIYVWSSVSIELSREVMNFKHRAEGTAFPALSSNQHKDLAEQGVELGTWSMLPMAVVLERRTRDQHERELGACDPGSGIEKSH